MLASRLGFLVNSTWKNRRYIIISITATKMDLSFECEKHWIMEMDEDEYDALPCYERKKIDQKILHYRRIKCEKWR